MHHRGAAAALGAVTLTLALVCAGVASAHEPQSNNGVTVTLHVDPDDAPVAGQPATVLFEEVRVGKGTTFTWRTCACTLTVAGGAGTTLSKGPASRVNRFTFPEPVAYQLALAGRVKRGTAWKAFKVAWALRAEPAS